MHAPATPSLIDTVARSRTVKGTHSGIKLIHEQDQHLVSPQGVVTTRSSKISEQRSSSPKIKSPFLIRTATPGQNSTAQFKPGFVGNLVSGNDEKTIVSRNG